jgi:hypothetical protein
MNKFADSTNNPTLYRTSSQTKTKVDDLYTLTPRITSSGPLGDVSIHAPMAANIWATSQFGSLVLDGGPLSGLYQTTGMWTDPITGLVSYGNPGDVGRLYVTYDSHGIASFATTVVQVGGSGLTGQFLVRGDLISQATFNGGISGTLAVEGNVGVGTVAGAVSQRLGGIVTNGGVLSGQIIILDSVAGGKTKKKGEVIGDIYISGGFKGGRMAVEGSIDSLIINGPIDSSSALVVGGSIGSLIMGDDLGILAVNGAISSLKIGKTSTAQFYGQNLTGADADAVSEVFLQDLFDGGVKTFDDTGLDEVYLALAEKRLSQLNASGGHLEF